MIDLGVVIVSWNTRAVTLEALRSLYADLAGSGLRAEVYVIDCASSDGTPEAIAGEFPQVQLTASRENLGFVRANNLAMRQMGFGEDRPTPRAVYLLNPDTITQPGATRTLYNALMIRPRAGLVGARLSYGDGSFQPSAFAFPGLRQIWTEFFPTPGRLIESRFNGRYPRALYQAELPFPCDFVLGATMMLKREVIEGVGMFDPEFFMYCEEIDWAWRIHDAGWDVLCVPAAHVVHLGGQSSGQARPQSILHLWRSRLRLYRKHHPFWKVWLARRMIAAGIARKCRALPPNAPPELRAAYQMVQDLAR